MCDCAFSPRCESNRFCEDADATMGVRDLRTGTIRKRAKWSIYVTAITGRFKNDRRFLFYCNECLMALQEAAKKPIPGLDKPEWASDFWRPSFSEMIRLAAINVALNEPPSASAIEWENKRMARYTPAMRNTLTHLRGKQS